MIHFLGKIEGILLPTKIRNLDGKMPLWIALLGAKEGILMGNLMVGGIRPI